VGLVRVPRYAWLFAMNTEAKMAERRSRLYVEKSRTRVLIKAVCLKELREMEGRGDEQEREYEELREMAPRVADGLVGVWRVYYSTRGISSTKTSREFSVKLSPRDFGTITLEEYSPRFLGGEVGWLGARLVS